MWPRISYPDKKGILMKYLIMTIGLTALSSLTLAASATKEFDETNYPWKDTTWVFVEMKSELLQKGYEPPIHDFLIEELEQGDVTDQVLNTSNYTYMLISPRLSEVPKRTYNDIFKLAEYLDRKQNPLLVLSASPTNELQQFGNQMQVNIRLANVDETVLKTIVRANPGLVVLQNGIVIAKFSLKNAPQGPELDTVLDNALQGGQSGKSKLIILSLLLIFGGAIIAPKKLLAFLLNFDLLVQN